MGYTFLYLFTASAYCFAIFLAVLSVSLARRGRWHWLAGCLLLACSMGTYQAVSYTHLFLTYCAVRVIIQGRIPSVYRASNSDRHRLSVYWPEK